MAAAYALARRGEDVLALEASDRAGGVVRTEYERGYLLELGPNTVRPTPELWALIGELGLSVEVLVADRGFARFIDFRGALHPVPVSARGLVRSGLLSTAGKLRLLAEPFVPRAGDRDESVHDFFARRLGIEIAERLVEPFVAGIFAGSARALSAADAFPVLRRWEREHGSLLAGAMASRRRKTAVRGDSPPRGLVSFRRGLEALPGAMARVLGPALRSGTAALGLAPTAKGWTVDTGTGELSAERVVLAAPADRAGALVRTFAPEAARALQAIPHPPLAVLHLSWPEASLPKPLRGFGHLVVPSANRRILGAVWSSSLFPERAPAGRALFTVFLGGSRDPQALDLSDQDLIDAASRDLQEEGLVRGAAEPLRVTRWPRAIPQYDRGHADRCGVLAEAEHRHPGLRFAGNYRRGVSVADVIRAGLEAGTEP